MGMAVATATLSVSLDIGDRLAQEFRSLGANLLVTPESDSLPLEIGGVDYRPANAGSYLPEGDLGKLKTIFWRFNIVAFAPMLEAQVKLHVVPTDGVSGTLTWPPTTVIGTWVNHEVKIPDGTTYRTGIERTNPWWQITKGRWFVEGNKECVVGSSFARKHGVRNRPLAPGFHLTSYTLDGHPGPVLEVVGITDTGGPEDEAVIVPLVLAQQLDGKPGMYRRLYVSALTKPEDAFARKDPKTMTPAEFDTWYCTPYISSIVVGFFVAILATLVPLNVLDEMTSVGTLLAFVLVSAGVWVMRRTHPELNRPFKTPMVPLVPILAIGFSLLLII